MNDFVPRVPFQRDDGLSHKFTQTGLVRVWCWRCMGRKAKTHGKLVGTVTEAYEWWDNHSATQWHIDTTTTESLVERLAQMFTTE